MTSSDQRPPQPQPPPEFEVMPNDDLPPERKSNTALIVWIVVGVVGLFLVGGLLLALVGPRLPELLDESRVSAAEADMWGLGQAIDNYRLSNKKLPSSLKELTRASAHSLHPFISSIPDDPWGNAYDYRVIDRTTYQIRSNGADGEPDTEDDIVWP